MALGLTHDELRYALDERVYGTLVGSVRASSASPERKRAWLDAAMGHLAAAEEALAKRDALTAAEAVKRLDALEREIAAS